MYKIYLHKIKIVVKINHEDLGYNNLISSNSAKKHTQNKTKCNNIYIFSNRSVNPGVLSIRVGSSFRDRNGTVIDVAEIFVHPKYNAEHIDYDYSLLRMAKPIRQSISTRAIMLPQQGENFKEGLLTTITGWGTLSVSFFLNFNDVKSKLT